MAGQAVATGLAREEVLMGMVEGVAASRDAEA